MKKSATLKSKEILLNRRKNNLPTYNFGLGENPFPQPKKLISILSKNSHKKFYNNIDMFPKVKNLIIKNYSIENYKVNDVILGNGLKEILFLVQMAFNGTIIHLHPSWVSYKEQTKILNKKTIDFNTKFVNNYKILPNELENLLKNINGDKMIIFNSPCNPTGILYTNDELKKLAKIINQHNCVIFADEIYLELCYQKNDFTISKYCPDLTIRGTSLSKTYASGGWRCGWATFPKNLENLYNKVNVLSSSIYSCITTPLIPVLGYVLKNKDEFNFYKKNIINIFNKITNEIYQLIINNTLLKVPEPKAAWYLFLDFRNYKEKLNNLEIYTSIELSEYLLNKFGIITVNGNSFSHNNLSLRLSCIDFNPINNYVISTYNDNMKEGINKLIKFLN